MNPVAVITGGSRGIGFETASFLAGHGWGIAICSRDTDDAVDAARRIQEEHGVQTLGIGADVSQPQDMDRFASEVSAKFGGVNALICNAAVLGPVGRLADVKPAAAAEAFGINVMGFVNGCNSFWPHLTSTKAFRIVALAGGGLGGPGQMTRTPAYVPSKAALASLVEIASGEVLDAGGTVNIIAPGNIPTGFMTSVLDAGPAMAGEVLYDQAAERQGLVIGNSLERFLDLLWYLLGDSSQFVSGRFLSARWNTPESLMALGTEGLTDSMFRLRRIDDDLYKESSS